ncbi:hypothetical protein EG327_003488 [Venturia inaequalis]|uniref:Myb-like domain-containing protein n=2 Tax=Venturia inaequalis TaxID=5025 RepID=A0A8H3VJP7_VENIN|nr:hypothetical protein EG327_003488 [Venturia inaequalis]
MPEAKVYIVELNGQKWPVVKFPKLLLKPEDISTRTEDYKKAVLPVEKNELRWVDPHELVLADTGDIFNLCSMAHRTGYRELQHACEQVVEHDKTSYWIQQYRSQQLLLQESLEGFTSSQVQVECKPEGDEAELEEADTEKAEMELAIRLSKEGYQRQTSNDQAIAGPSGSKRARSLTLDADPDDDLYSLPSSAKRSRMGDKTSSTSSSESSVTLRHDSHPSKSSLNMVKTPSPAEVRRLREENFLPKLATSQQNKEEQEESKTQKAKPIQPSSSLASSVPPAVKPRRFMDTLVDCTRFDQQKDEYNTTKKRLPENPGPGPLSVTESSEGAWTVAQDAELIRLRERAKPAFSWMQIDDALKRKFHGLPSTKPSRHYDSMIKEGALTGKGNASVNGYRARKAALALLDSEMSEQVRPSMNRRHDDQPNDSDSEESEAEEVREDWLAGSSTSSSSALWSTLEDAELIRVRERTEPVPSWQDIADELNVKFHSKAVETKPRTQKNTRDRWRYISGEESRSKAGIKWRNKALALLDGDDASLVQLDNSSNAKIWSKEEDDELVMLRDQELPDTPWDELAEIYNARLHARPDYEYRSGSSLWQRYDRISNKWKQSATSQLDSMLDFVRKGGMERIGKSTAVPSTPSKTWTTAQDDELVRLRKSMPSQSWHDVAVALQSVGEKKGWPSRSAETIRTRYNKELRQDVIGDQAATSTSTQSASGCPLRLWTRMEDEELLRLRRSMPDQSWADVASVYNRWLKMRGHGNRTSNGLQRRYSRLLADQPKKLPFEIVPSSSSTLSDIMPYSRAWTSLEDDELLRLRTKMFRESWSEVAAAFVDQNRGKGWRERSGPSLRSRYELLMDQAKISKPSNVIIIDDDDNPVPTTQLGPRLFTSEQDGELILLREKEGGQVRWDAIADDFNRKFPHVPRSANSLRSRYHEFLKDDPSRRPDNVSQRKRAIDALKQRGIEHQVETFISDSKRFTAEEDGELIRLREKFRGMVRWDEIQKHYIAKFPDTPRTTGSLSSRYSRVLQELAFDQLQGGVNQRERALAALRKQGIELQVNDPISDSSSEEEDETEDESGQEEDDEQDDNGTQVTILIGENKDRFTVPLSRIETNRYFLDDEYEDLTTDHLIQGHRWTAIRPKDFIPVHEFILHGEFTPPLSASKKSLVGISTDAEHNTHLLRCAQVFVLARQLLMWDLAALAIYKFQLLRKEAVYLLKAAEMVFAQPASEQETDRVMRALLVEEVARRYWEFAGSQPSNMQDVMGKSPLFEVALYERKAQMARERFDKMGWE